MTLGRIWCKAAGCGDPWPAGGCPRCWAAMYSGYYVDTTDAWLFPLFLAWRRLVGFVDRISRVSRCASCGKRLYPWSPRWARLYPWSPRWARWHCSWECFDNWIPF